MGKDRYQYFRIEAREHIEGLSSGVLDLEKRAGDHELVNRLLRHAHTLKGAARVVRQPEIAELSHELEDVLTRIRDGEDTANRDNINKLLQLIDAITTHVKLLAEPQAAANASQDAPASAARGRDQTAATLDTVRVAITELDPLLDGCGEVGINLGALRQHATTLDQLIESAGDEELRSSLQQFRRPLLALVERTQRELSQLQDKTAQLRLLPASSLFISLERTVRDAADSLGRQVEFTSMGGENRIDAHVLRGLSDALLHLVRNAVSHGIESPEERIAANKPAAGRVELAVERHGNRLTFICRDDGRGVDVEQIQRVAASRGLMATDADPLSPEQAVQLLFRGGISTAGAVTQHAGRGVGLDVVRETVEQLQGSVEMRSTPSMQTVVRISVPVSLESLSILNVEVAGQRTGIPFDAVRRVLHVSDADIAHTPDGDAVLFNDTPMVLISLHRLLSPQMRIATPQPARQVVVIIDAEQGPAAIVVDRVLGRTTAVLKPLPAILAGTDLVLGASLDSSGNPQIVLDSNRLAEAGRQAPGAAPPLAPQPKSRVLVVDDSLTTRMLEQGILETAGYEVDLAVSGEDAVAKAKQREYAIFVVDVEMPGMSGYEFIAHLKSDPDLQQIPAILVTSRQSAEDQARGEAVGAADYIVKSEFAEATFLSTIRRLVAES